MSKYKPDNIIKLIKKFPEILSGRKNYKKNTLRVKKNLDLTKKYFSKKSKF